VSDTRPLMHAAGRRCPGRPAASRPRRSRRWSRSGLAAIAFVTKRAEASFTEGRTLPPYFRERADWQFVSAVLDATLRERLKFERSWIMRACKGARTLADVQRNVRREMDKAKGLSADVYMTLDHYLDIVIPQIERLPLGSVIAPGPGLNIMDLAEYTTELQALVIRSVLEWVYESARGTLVIIPEAWEFIPQNRGSPVLLACEQLIRKGGAAKNFVWLDSQDIAGVHKNILRSGVWILGVQREANEIKRALAHIPGNVRKPSADDIMGLERGQFFACYGRGCGRSRGQRRSRCCPRYAAASSRKIRSHNHVVNRSWGREAVGQHFVVDYVTRIFEKSVFTEIARSRQSGCGPAAALIWNPTD
jgi:hypothetical protein